MSLTLWSLWSQRLLSSKPSCSMLFLHLAGSTQVLVLVSAARNCQAAFSGCKQWANVALHLHLLAWRLTWQKPWCAQYRFLSHNGQNNLSVGRKKNLSTHFRRKILFALNGDLFPLLRKAVWKIIFSHQRKCPLEKEKDFAMGKVLAWVKPCRPDTYCPIGIRRILTSYCLRIIRVLKDISNILSLFFY